MMVLYDLDFYTTICNSIKKPTYFRSERDNAN